LAESKRRLLVVVTMVVSDIALATWHLSGIAAASIVPNLAVWICLRGLLGLYPGYGRSQVEELRRQAFSLLTAVTIMVVSAFAFYIGDSLSRPLIFA
jgi:hypothetical protein